MEHYNNTPKMPVECTVENCSYNQSRMCHANKIKVNATGDRKAETRDGTCCSTFENKMEQALLSDKQQQIRVPEKLEKSSFSGVCIVI